METWDALRARRNVRTFTDQAISQEDLDRITEAGWRAPSASNTQPWDFVVCTDRELLIQLATLWQGAGHVATSAATIVLVAPVNDDRKAIIEYDLGQATLQMMVTAADLGIGTAHASIGEKDRAREILGFPEDKYAAYFIAMGYPADRPLKPIVKPNRRPIGEVVHYNHW
jgi:nitroreductase